MFLKKLLIIAFIIILMIPIQSFSAVTVKKDSGVSPISAKNFQFVDGVPNSFYGQTVTGIGDYNLNGYQDFIVTGRIWNHYQGRTWVYFTGPNGIKSANATFTITGEPLKGTDGLCFGRSSLAVGDINGDNVTDFVVGATGSYGLWDVGKIYIFFGNSTTKSGQANFLANETLVSPIKYDWLGESMAYLGDFNGDGYPDLAVGAPSTPHGGGPDFGSVYIYFGNGHGFSQTPNLILRDNKTNDDFGARITTGDFNGDGLTDIAINTNNGPVYMFYGRKIAMNTTNKLISPNLTINAPANDYNFGSTLGSVTDFSNPQISDLAIAYTKINGSSVPGYVGIYKGGRDANYTKPTYELTSGISNDLFGKRIVNIGDINHDGYNDFAIGAPGKGDNSNLPGSLYIYYGGPNFSGKPSVIYTGENPQDQFGYTVGTIKINNTLQLLISAPGYNITQGRVYLTVNRNLTKITTTNKSSHPIPGFTLGLSFITLVFIVKKKKNSLRK